MRRTRIALWLVLMGYTSITQAAEEWIDLIRPTDPAKHAVQGEWTATSDGLVTKGSSAGSRPPHHAAAARAPGVASAQ